MDTLPDPERVLAAEGYKLRRNIGEGGYGRVWMADTPGGDTVALKIVEGRDGDRTAFDRERDALVRMRNLGLVSEHLVPVDDIEIHEEHGFLSYTMPLADDVSGNPVIDRDAYKARTLAEEISRRGRIPVPECVAVCKRVLGAVKALHDKGFIHRDIKPANVIYVKGLPVLADFGLVTHEGADVSQACSPTNKPPEGVGAMSGDLYAVAVLLYRMATGNKAESFPSSTAGSPTEAFKRLAHVYTMAGEKVPSRRYVNAKAMEMALEWALEDKPAPASMPKRSIWNLFRRASRRKCPDQSVKDRLNRKIRDIVESAKLEARTPQGEQRCMTPEEFNEATNSVCREFERKIGYEPPLVKAACLNAEAVMAPSRRERRKLRKRATALVGGAASVYAILIGLALFFGWSQGIIAVVIAFIIGGPVFLPLALVVGGITAAVIAIKLLFSKDDPKATADQAVKVLLEGVDAAVVALWAKYGDQLSV